MVIFQMDLVPECLRWNHYHQQTNTQPFLLLRNQKWQNTVGKNITFHGLALSSPGGLSTLSLTTDSSWLPWSRVAMPLISPLMPVTQYKLIYKRNFKKTTAMHDLLTMNLWQVIYLFNHQTHTSNLYEFEVQGKRELVLSHIYCNGLCGRPPQYVPPPN